MHLVVYISMILILFVSFFLIADCENIKKIQLSNRTSKSVWDGEEKCTGNRNSRNQLSCKHVGVGIEMLCMHRCEKYGDCVMPMKCFDSGWEEMCFRPCARNGTCEEHRTCFQVPKACHRICVVHGDCERHMKCSNGRYCTYETCYKDRDCDGSSICAGKSDVYGGICLRACNCGENGSCRILHYHKTCECDPGFAEKDGKCIECKCGLHETCWFVNGQKTCNCEEGFIKENGTCTECKCGLHESCSFVNGEKTCKCKKGFAEKNGTCTECKCGLHETCKFVNDQITCNCEDGFVKKNGRCTDCICRGGTCVLENGKENCKCPPGFGNFTRISCKACNCGPNTNCIWESKFGGNKICLCKPGYSTNRGKCVACDCGPDSSCEWINKRWFKPEKKICICKSGYHEESGKCVDMKTTTSGDSTSTNLPSTTQDCHCGLFSHSCSFNSGSNKVCRCFAGYTQLGETCASKKDLKIFFLNLLDKIT